MGSKPSRQEDASHKYAHSASFNRGNLRRNLNRVAAGDSKNSPLFLQTPNLSAETPSRFDISGIQSKKADRLLMSHINRASTANINLSAYQKSSYYKRKIYADSLPRLRSRENLESNGLSNRPTPNSISQVSRALPSLYTCERMSDKHSPTSNSYSGGVRLYPRPNTSCGRLTTGCSIDIKPTQRILLNQQWNDNHWAETDSIESRELPKIVENKRNNPKNLPQLMPMRLLLNKFESELGSSSASLRKGMMALVDSDLLVGRLPSEQKQLLGKTEDGIMNVQSLLAKMHQHIAQAHEFCNMLHRIDESLQTFSKAVSTVTAWEQKRDDCFQHSQPTGDGPTISTRKVIYRS